MTFLRHRDSEALLDGTPVARGAGLGEVERVISGLRIEAAVMPAPAPRPRLAATLDGRRPLPPASDPVPDLARDATRRTRASLRLRVSVVAAAISAVLFGGLAAAGALPAPVQRTSAQVMSHLGVQIPGRTTSPHRPSSHIAPRTGNTHAPTSAVVHPKSPSNTTVTIPASATTPLPTGTTLPTSATVTTLPISPTSPVAPTLPKSPTLPTLPGATVVTVPVRIRVPISLPLPGLGRDVPDRLHPSGGESRDR